MLQRLRSPSGWGWGARLWPPAREWRVGLGALPAALLAGWLAGGFSLPLPACAWGPGPALLRGPLLLAGPALPAGAVDADSHASLCLTITLRWPWCTPAFSDQPHLLQLPQVEVLAGGADSTADSQSLGASRPEHPAAASTCLLPRVQGPSAWGAGLCCPRTPAGRFSSFAQDLSL